MVVSETGVLATVHASAADGVLMASAERLFASLSALELAAGAVIDAVENGGEPTGDLLPNLVSARLEAARALLLAAEPTEH